MTRKDCSGEFDLAVVGAGIVGLAVALAAARRGMRVIVIDRDALALGASVRNFGFITVTGQERRTMWPRARRSREIWLEVAAAAAIPVVQTGLWVMARFAESVDVLEAFLATEMAAGCQLLSPAEAARLCPQLAAAHLVAVFRSNAELRIEAREAIPRLASWLSASHAVTFLRSTSVCAIDMPRIATSRGIVRALRVAVCPGDDFNSLYPERLAGSSLLRCKLQMLRLASPGFRLPASLMSDLGLGRYLGYADLPECAPLKARLRLERPQHLQHGIHLIVTQSEDGTLVVGDSHHYGEAPDPFAREEVDALILEEFARALGFAPPAVLERWVGTYASAAGPVLLDAPEPAVRVAIVTCGAGMSSAFALGEELVESLAGVAA